MQVFGVRFVGCLVCCLISFDERDCVGFSDLVFKLFDFVFLSVCRVVYRMGRYVQEPDVHFEVCLASIHVVVDGAEKISVGCALFFRLFFLVKAGDGFDCAEGVRSNDDVGGHSEFFEFFWFEVRGEKNRKKKKKKKTVNSDP